MVVGPELQLVVRTQTGEKVVSRQHRAGEGAQPLEPGIEVSLEFTPRAGFLLSPATAVQPDQESEEATTATALET